MFKSAQELIKGFSYGSTYERIVDLINNVVTKKELEDNPIGGTVDFNNLTRSESIAISNAIQNINGGFFVYYADQLTSTDNFTLKFVQSQEYIKTFTPTFGTEKKWIFPEETSATILVDSLNLAPLTGSQYYYIGWQTNNYYQAQILFGNNLGDLPQGFNFGTTSGRLYMNFNKQNTGTQLTPTNINVTYVNNTTADVRYRLESSYSGQPEVNSDSIYTMYSNVTNNYYRNIFCLCNGNQPKCTFFNLRNRSS
jgi:hypothetical protein